MSQDVSLLDQKDEEMNNITDPTQIPLPPSPPPPDNSTSPFATALPPTPPPKGALSESKSESQPNSHSHSHLHSQPQSQSRSQQSQSQSHSDSHSHSHSPQVQPQSQSQPSPTRNLPELPKQGVKEKQVDNEKVENQPIPPPRETSRPSSSHSASHPSQSRLRQSQQQQQQQQQQNKPPQFDFNRFLEQLQHRSAEPVVKYFRSFLREFAKRTLSVKDQTKAINDFLDFIADKMRECQVWASLDQVSFDHAIDAMEKLVMTRLYHLTFVPAMPAHLAAVSATDDVERDHVLCQRIRLFGPWIRPKHLDLGEVNNNSSSSSTKSATTPTASPSTSPSTSPTIPLSNEEKEEKLEREKARQRAFNSFRFACDELCKMNQYKAPRDKLVCFLNCCKAIFEVIKIQGGEQGADAFVPWLIFVILKANPDHLVSNVQYIQRFRNPDRLRGEAGYYLSSLTGAITFIDTLDYTTLSNITREEFERDVEEAIKRLPPEASETPRVQQASKNPKTGEDIVDFGGVEGDAGEYSTMGTPTKNHHQQQKQQEEGDDDEQQIKISDVTQWLQRSSQAAQRTVSKPLNAISRILAELADEEDEEERREEISSPYRQQEQRQRQPQPYSQSQSQSQARPHPHPHSHSQHEQQQQQRQLYQSYPGYQQQQQEALQQSQQGLYYYPTRRDSNNGSRDRGRLAHEGNLNVSSPATSSSRFSPGDYLPDDADAVGAVIASTANININIDNDNNNNNNTANSKTATEAEDQDQKVSKRGDGRRTQSVSRNSEQRKANVATLRSMFPELDEEVVEIVLMSAAGDLDGAIDALLEMG